MGSNSSVKFCGIPAGNGPHSVGCTDLMSDHTIQGSFVRLYYPCSDSENYEDAVWIPGKEYHLGLADTMNMNRTIGNYLFSYFFGSVTCPAKWNAPFKPGEKYPLIIFSHGLGAFRIRDIAKQKARRAKGSYGIILYCRDASASATYYFREKSPSDACEQDCGLLEEVWLYNRTLKPPEQEYPLRFEQVSIDIGQSICCLNLA
ncbi:hypothetical protein FKM82_011322 [Ascaphus truei]